MQLPPLPSFATMRAACLLLTLPPGLHLAQGSGTWTQEAPNPTADNVLGIAVVSADEVFAVASPGLGDRGLVVHSGDGGTTWDTNDFGAQQLNAIAFYDDLLGWAAGNGIWRTTDGGNTWAQTSSFGTVQDLFFVDDTFGWAAANGGIVYRTIDGGASWPFSVSTPVGTTISSIWFIDPLVGWVVGINGSIAQTTDGGQTWNSLFFANDYLSTIQFFDALEGWAIGGDTFLHTQDGGTSWVAASVPLGTWSHGARFFDRMTGISVGMSGNILYTSDGGTTWTRTTVPAANHDFWDVEFADANTAYLSGYTGTLFRTDDSGATWQTIQSGAFGITRGLDAVDTQTAWAANQGGEIVRTTDGGALWERISVAGFSSLGDLHDVDFVDASTGWVVGEEAQFLASFARISKSEDGGLTWDLQLSLGDGSEFFGVTAFDDQTVMAYGRGLLATSSFLRTTDGGQSWVAGGPAVGSGFRDATVLPGTQTAWLVGSYIHKTTDAGVTWTQQYDNSAGAQFSAVSFSDAMNGWAVGFQGLIVRTTDGGATWVPQNTGAPVGAALLGVTATGPNSAWVTGWNDFTAHTADGGLTWQPVVLANDDFSMFEVAEFINDGYGWVAGNLGIWHYQADGAPASATTRNGSGTNPSVFATLTLPILGTAWSAEVDAAAAGANGGVTFVLGYQGPSAGLATSFGELLVDVTSPLLFGTIAPVVNGLSVHSTAIPSDNTLVGFTLTTQAYLGATGQVTNALDLVLGAF